MRKESAHYLEEYPLIIRIEKVNGQPSLVQKISNTLFFFPFLFIVLKYKVYPFGYTRIEGDSKVNPAKIEKVTWLHFKQRKQRIKRTLAFMFCYTWPKKKKKKRSKCFFSPKSYKFLEIHI